METTEEAMEVSHGDLSHIVKGKRTKRQRQSPAPAMASSTSDERVMASPAATTSTGEFSYSTEEDEDMANCLILLAQSGGDGPKPNSPGEPAADGRATNFVSKRGPDLYECKTCSKCFPSFQALGGHRASHKKPKAGEEKEKAMAAGAAEEEGFRLFKEASMAVVMQQQQQGGAKAGGKPKVHECSICGSEFTSGQALGGHMRRHRIVAESPDSKKQKNGFTLDLNLPAPEDSEPATEFSDFTRKPTLMFATLVDCHN